MNYLSVCSGIEAATKACAKCSTVKPVGDFHRQPTGPMGRHSWCKPCANEAQKVSRAGVTRPTKRAWNLKTRYGLTVADVDAMLAFQGGQCGLCECDIRRRYHIDHDHETGLVRGLLCHRCNVVIGGMDDRSFRAKAIAWMDRSL